MGHTTKRIALPAGWEDFNPTPRGRPDGKHWITAREYARATGVSDGTARIYLNKQAADGRIDVEERVIGRCIVRFYSPQIKSRPLR